MTIPKSTVTGAFHRAQKKTAAQLSSKVLHAGRQAASFQLDISGVPEKQIKKMLNHAESDTTRVHYATAPPFQSVYSLAGFNKFGNDFDVIHALARKELEDSYMGT